MKQFLLVAAVILSSKVYGEETTFEYRASRYPVRGEECTAAAKELGKRFEQITGRLVLRSACDAQTNGFLDLVVTYAGETPLELVSTDDEFAIEQGFYPSLASCRASMPLEIQQFEEHTGLKSVISYCYRFNNSGGSYPHPYTLRIDGFGAARLAPVLLSRTIYATPVDNMQIVADKVRIAAEAQGLVWPRVVLGPAGDLHQLVMKYYAPKTRPVQMVQYTSYPSSTECAARIHEVEAVYGSVDSVPLVSFCARRSHSAVTELYSLLYVKGSFQKTSFQSRYSSMSECDGDKLRIGEWFRTARGVDVVGALCSYQEYDLLNPEGVFMHLFFKS